MIEDESLNVSRGFIPLAKQTSLKLIFDFGKDTKSEIRLGRIKLSDDQDIVASLFDNN